MDGLRALAVVAVVLFHAAVPGFGGGFVGVDVFFVISGYLITGIILRDQERGQFSLARFYERRIRRIFPALIVVVAVTWMIAADLLLPQPFKDFSQSLVALALFSTNLLFYSESGYFDAASELKPLLHTWSLAVEEQFYLLFPLALLFLRRMCPRRWPWGIAVVAAVSLAASEWAVTRAPAAAFYLPQYRVWELALGALLAAPIGRSLLPAFVRESAAAAGLALIVWATWSFTSNTPFPGISALVPCLGAALLIYTGGEGPTRTHRLLMLRPVVFTGLISYSLYLWHWPLIVFAGYAKFGALRIRETAAVIALSVLLAVVSWRFVEQPFRRPAARVEPSWRGPAQLAAAAALLALVVSGVFGQVTSGWHSRHAGYAPPEIRGAEDYNRGNCLLSGDRPPSAWGRDGDCVLDRGASQTVLLWGDSFAAHYVPGLKRTDWKGANFVQYNQSACPPVLDAEIPDRPYCGQFNDGVWSIIERYGVDTVVLSARWELYWNKQITGAMVRQTVDRLRDLDVTVVVIGQSPLFESVDDPYDYVYRRGTDLVVSQDFSALNWELAMMPGVSAFFEPWPAVCRGNQCRLRDGYRYYFIDFGHYSSLGSEQMVKKLIPVLEQAL